MNVKNETPAGELSDADIRKILLGIGYTIKPDCDDLKSYVYAGARAVIAVDRALRPVVSAPTGWQLVPVEPTHEILTAMLESEGRDDQDKFPPLCYLLDFSGENKARTVVAAAYRAMLAAAPKPPTAVVPAGDVVMTMKTQLEGEIKLVRQTDTQAALAAKDAEIARLRAELATMTINRDMWAFEHQRQIEAKRELVDELAAITAKHDAALEKLAEVKAGASPVSVAPATEAEMEKVFSEMLSYSGQFEVSIWRAAEMYHGIGTPRLVHQTEAKPDAQAGPVLLTDAQIDAVLDRPQDMLTILAKQEHGQRGVLRILCRAIEAAVHAANQVLANAEIERLKSSHADLLKAARKAILALAHVVTNSKMRELYEADYIALNAAIDKADRQEGGAA